MHQRDDFGFEVEFVSGPEDKEDGDGDVGSGECIGPEGDKSVITFEKGNDADGDQDEV